MIAEVSHAQVEAELTELDKEEAEEYLTSLGATEGGLSSLIRATYKQLGLLTYFTTGGALQDIWQHVTNILSTRQLSLTGICRQVHCADDIARMVQNMSETFL